MCLHHDAFNIFQEDVKQFAMNLVDIDYSKIVFVIFSLKNDFNYF